MLWFTRKKLFLQAVSGRSFFKGPEGDRDTSVSALFVVGDFMCPGEIGFVGHDEDSAVLCLKVLKSFLSPGA